MTSNDLNWPQMTSNDLKWSQMTSDNKIWHQMTSNDLKWPPTTSNDRCYQRFLFKVGNRKCTFIWYFRVLSSSAEEKREQKNYCSYITTGCTNKFGTSLDLIEWSIMMNCWSKIYFWYKTYFWSKLTSNDLKWPQIISKYFKLPQITSNNLKWPQITSNDLKWP